VVAIPVFPGTNCEYDTAARFHEAGANCKVMVFKNLTPDHLEESLTELVKLIDSAHILALPGGFSGGDEPDGSGKFIASVFRNPRVADAVHRLLKQRDGLALGICNGFQALIKLGLLPYGEIRDLTPNDPTLTFNTIGRHQAIMVRTRISSTASPWLSLHNVGDIHIVPISHGEGRLVAPQGVMSKLAQNGQIATQYVGLDGKATMEMPFNPNGSMLAAEGLLSPDGRVFGKMAHSERLVPGLYKNIPGSKAQRIIESGVNYFK
jgi:phosphoribosylformylglycinamidine synthase